MKEHPFYHFRYKSFWKSSPKNENLLKKYTHPQAIQEVDEFVSSLEQKFSITSLIYQWIICSE